MGGPITVVSGKKRRLTFIECPNDISSMIDLGKIADLVLLMVDGSFGFEMETFEFLNVVQVSFICLIHFIDSWFPSCIRSCHSSRCFQRKQASSSYEKVN